MHALKIKEAHKLNIVGFNNSGTPLGFRSQEDLVDLAIMARSADDTYLLSFFEGEVPTMDVLKKQKAKTSVPATPVVAPAAKVEPPKSNEDGKS